MAWAPTLGDPLLTTTPVPHLPPVQSANCPAFRPPGLCPAVPQARQAPASRTCLGQAGPGLVHAPILPGLMADSRKSLTAGEAGAAVSMPCPEGTLHTAGAQEVRAEWVKCPGNYPTAHSRHARFCPANSYTSCSGPAPVPLLQAVQSALRPWENGHRSLAPAQGSVLSSGTRSPSSLSTQGPLTPPSHCGDTWDPQEKIQPAPLWKGCRMGTQPLVLDPQSPRPSWTSSFVPRLALLPVARRP